MKCQRNHGNQIEEEIESGKNYNIRSIKKSSDCFEAPLQCRMLFLAICSPENLQHKGYM